MPDWVTGLQDWFGASGQTSGHETIFRILTYLFSRIVGGLLEWMGQTVGGSFATGRDSVMVQLPLSLTVQAQWVLTGHHLFSNVANAAVYGVFLIALLIAATGGLLGFTTSEARSVLAVSVLIWYANRRALEFVAYLISLSNTGAAQFANPTELLPGWSHLTELQRGSGEGMMLFFTGLTGILLSLVRWATLLGVNVLIIVMPLALLFAIHPATKGWFTMWWRGLLGLILVQIPMALAIGQGQALVGQYGAGAGGGTLVAGIACFWLAHKMTKMVGGLAAMPGQVASGPGNFARSVGTFAVAGTIGAGIGGKLAGANAPALAAPAAPTPQFRSAPLQPAPLGLPAPRAVLAAPAPGSWPGSYTRKSPAPDIMDIYPTSVE